MRSKPTLDEYLSTNIEIKDGVLSSSLLDISIMDDQETLIMEESAKVICKNGGDILNVGFGLGIIDSYIQQHKIKSHTIIEIHPGVIQHAKNLGFDITTSSEIREDAFLFGEAPSRVIVFVDFTFFVPTVHSSYIN